MAISRRADGRRAIVAINAGDGPAELDLGSVGGAVGLSQLDLPGIGAGRVADGGGAIVLPD